MELMTRQQLREVLVECNKFFTKEEIDRKITEYPEHYVLIWDPSLKKKILSLRFNCCHYWTDYIVEPETKCLQCDYCIEELQKKEKMLQKDPKSLLDIASSSAGNAMSMEQYFEVFSGESVMDGLYEVKTKIFKSILERKDFENFSYTRELDYTCQSGANGWNSRFYLCKRITSRCATIEWDNDGPFFCHCHFTRTLEPASKIMKECYVAIRPCRLSFIDKAHGYHFQCPIDTCSCTIPPRCKSCCSSKPYRRHIQVRKMPETLRGLYFPPELWNRLTDESKEHLVEAWFEGWKKIQKVNIQWISIVVTRCVKEWTDYIYVLKWNWSLSQFHSWNPEACTRYSWYRALPYDADEYYLKKFCI